MFDLNTKILIVDDMMTVRKIVKKILVDLKYKNITEAHDGAMAWELLSQEKDYQLIISDWNMPNLTGIDLLQKVRQDEKLKIVPFVLLTAEADGAQVKQALDLAVDNYIVKPFTPAILKTKLEQTYSKTKDRKAA